MAGVDRLEGLAEVAEDGVDGSDDVLADLDLDGAVAVGRLHEFAY